MRTSAEFLSDLQPVIDRIAGGPMSNERIDVLASLDFAANLCEALPKGGSYTKDLRAARAVVAELIAAGERVLLHRVGNQPIAGWLHDTDASRTELTRLRAALARVGGGK